MGFQWRKRTKGKKAWLNFSASKSRGVGASASIKFGNMTANVGSGGRRRVTVNFGNGLKYVKTRAVKPKVHEERPKRDIDAFMKSMDELNERMEKSKANIENLTLSETRWLLLFLFVIILIIQLTMKSCS